MPYEQPQVTTGDVSKVDKIMYDAIDTDHEYKGLDQYSKRDGEIESISPKGLDSIIQKTQQPVTEDYEYTDCPAYAPITTQHGGNTESDVAAAMKED